MVATTFVLLFTGTVAAVYAMQPSSYRIARSRLIHATPAEVLPELVDLRRFDAWSEHMGNPDDPPSITFSANPVGVGAYMDWKDSMTTSRLTLKEVSEHGVRFESVQAARLGVTTVTKEVVLTPKGDDTEVALVVSAPMSGLPRLLWPVVDLERRVSPSMDDALKRLETLVAPQSTPRP
jgi:hypothetical protein